MIQLTFMRGSSLRKIYINNRIITMVTPELNGQPLVLDINKAAMFQDQRMTELLKEVGITNFEKYTNDQVIADEIIEEFKLTNWRCIRK